MPESRRVMSEVEETNNRLKETIKSLETWFRWMAIGGIVAFCSTVLVAFGLFKYQEQAADDKLETLNTIRDERSIGACRQDNIQTEKTRTFAKDQLVQVFSIFSRQQLLPEEIRKERAEQLKEYELFVDSSFPYRDCSEPCVVAYLTEAPDCPAPQEFPE